MEIKENKIGETAELIVSGRIDTSTAPNLELSVKNSSRGMKNLIIDMKDVEYISSAGLRVILVAHKLMAGFGGRMALRTPSAFVRQVLAATGMESILTII